MLDKKCVCVCLEVMQLHNLRVTSVFFVALCVVFGVQTQGEETWACVMSTAVYNGAKMSDRVAQTLDMSAACRTFRYFITLH